MKVARGAWGVDGETKRFANKRGNQMKVIVNQPTPSLANP